MNNQEGFMSVGEGIRSALRQHRGPELPIVAKSCFLAMGSLYTHAVCKEILPDVTNETSALRHVWTT